MHAMAPIGDAGPIAAAVTLLYFVAAWGCDRARRSRPRQAGFWAVLTAGLILLGVNKQADLQTIAIELLRELSKATGWYRYRRVAQAAAMAGAAILLAGGAVLAWRRAAGGDGPVRLAMAGALALMLFVGQRAMSILHVIERGDRTTGLAHLLLEPAGVATILIAARIATARARGPAGSR